jgi:hypothetical protein
MAKYRRELTSAQHRQIVDKFKDHMEAPGGIFTESTRHRLIGVKDTSSKLFKDDVPDFWLDVRTYATNALIDLNLLASVADPEQLRQIFAPLSFREWNAKENKYPRDDPSAYLQMLLWSSHEPVASAVGEWKRKLARRLMELAVNHFKDHPEFASPLHKRVFEEALAACDIVVRDINPASK